MANRDAVGVPAELLIAVEGFDGIGPDPGAALPARVVADALRRGLVASGQPARVASLDDPDYDLRMRAARAVVTGTGRLDRAGLVGSALSEIATRARQAGVPCHAVVGDNELDLFDLRILDLQLVLEASSLPEIEAAGAELGHAIQAESALGR